MTVQKPAAGAPPAGKDGKPGANGDPGQHGKVRACSCSGIASCRARTQTAKSGTGGKDGKPGQPGSVLYRVLDASGRTIEEGKVNRYRCSSRLELADTLSSGRIGTM